MAIFSKLISLQILSSFSAEQSSNLISLNFLHLTASGRCAKVNTGSKREKQTRCSHRVQNSREFRIETLSDLVDRTNCNSCEESENFSQPIFCSRPATDKLEPMEFRQSRRLQTGDKCHSQAEWDKLNFCGSVNSRKIHEMAWTPWSWEATQYLADSL